MRAGCLTMIAVIVIMTAITVCGTNVYAEDNNIFEITGGLDMQKGKETTFDSSRIVSGTAKKGTEITITVYTKNDDGDYEEADCIEMEVGSSGYFSENIDFYIGMNYITIEAEKNGEHSVEEIKVKRKDSSIMKELRQNIALPGKR